MNIFALLTIAGTGKTRQNSIRVIALKSPLLLFIFGNKISRRFGLIALVGTILQFIIFKLLYPYPDFISDSRSYIETNLYHMNVNLWPVGYSKFLALLHLFSNSDTFLVAVQYVILQASLLYFFYSILILYQPTKMIARVLWIFLFLNPLFLYLSNCVLSDALFASLSIVFFTELLWLLRTGSYRHIFIQALTLGIAFTVRYTAIYYPLLSIAALLLTHLKWQKRLLGILSVLIATIPFYAYTAKKTMQITGIPEFSVFGGWQMANNALYMYDHITVDSSLLPPETAALDAMAKQYFKDVPEKYRDLEVFPGTFFIKTPNAVLKPYMQNHYTFDDPPSNFRAWGMVSPIYKKYGLYLIFHHPFAFARYFLWLNAKNYFLPHLEKLTIYNRGLKTVHNHVQDWFDYTTPEVSSISATAQGKIFYVYPILFMFLNLYFLYELCHYKWKGTYHYFNPYFKSSIGLVSIFLLINFIFSVFATPIVLRYEIVPLILLMTFCLLMFEIPNNPIPLKSNQSH